MKTSAAQFEIMVDFMETNGDMSRPAEGPDGRVAIIQGWSKLTSALNADPTGDQRNANKWRKVWSDLKNNTRRKVSRLKKAEIESGRHGSIRSKLTKLERRVLSILKAADPLRPGISITPPISPTLPPDVVHPIAPSAIFVKPEAEWRASQGDILRPSGSDDFESERLRLEDERLRLRDIELQQQARWQELFGQFLGLMNKIIDKNT